MTTLNRQDHVEQADFEHLIAVYERLTELKLLSVRQDNRNIWIDWAYSDGSWAGVTCCDLPLEKANKKLEQEVEWLEKSNVRVA